jgi:hypothetical protein
VCLLCCSNLIFKHCLDDLRVSTGKDKYFAINSKITKCTIVATTTTPTIATVIVTASTSHVI